MRSGRDIDVSVGIKVNAGDLTPENQNSQPFDMEGVSIDISSEMRDLVNVSLWTNLIQRP